MVAVSGGLTVVGGDGVLFSPVFHVMTTGFHVEQIRRVQNGNTVIITRSYFTGLEQGSIFSRQAGSGRKLELPDYRLRRERRRPTAPRLQN